MPIKKVGIELEGGWATRPDLDNIHLVDDASVEGVGQRRGTEMCDCSCECSDEDHCGGEYNEDCEDCHVCRGETCQVDEDAGRLAWVGEARPREPLGKAEVSEWMRNAYPTEYNRSCGLHVHVSFDEPWEYTSLQSQKFYDTFMRWASKKARQVGDLTTQGPRLRGANRYCKAWSKVDDLAGQLEAEGYVDERYRHINFCWAKHGTLEFRLWGMTDLRKSRRLVQGTLDFVEAWLAKHGKTDDGEALESVHVETETEVWQTEENTEPIVGRYACV